MVAFRLALTPFATWEARRRLAGFQHLRTTFSSLSLSLWNGSCTVNDVKTVKLPTPPKGEVERPYFFAKQVHVGIVWKDLLFHRQLVAGLRLVEPHINLIQGKTQKQKQITPEEPDLSGTLARLLPIDVERVEVIHGQVAFVDATEPREPALWVHDLDATVENLASRVGLSNGQPTMLAAKGVVNKTGAVTMFVTADPLSKTLAFAGRAALEHMALSDLGNFITTKAGLGVRQGTIDLFMEFAAHDGHISGGIKPVLKNAKVNAAKPDFFDELKAVFADTALDIVSNRTGEGKEVATVIPIKGDITDPKAQLWPTVFGVIRNGFVVGLAGGFSGLPPPTAKKQENIFQQAGHALSKRSRPHAQPQKKESK
jgi:hypothetical protein